MKNRMLLFVVMASSLVLGCPGKEGAKAGGPDPAKGGESHAEQGGGGHEEVVELPPEAVRSAQLKTAPAQRKELSIGLTVPARVTFTQNGVARVAARVPGRLASLEVSLSQRVKKGQPLAEGVLKPGMFAQAEVATQTEDSADSGTAPSLRLVLPREAIQKVGEAEVVFVPSGVNRFKPVQVRTGASSAMEVELVSGLEEGTPVVTQGAFILKSELLKESMGEGDSH